MKIDTRFGSMWDELPSKRERKVPETKEEALDLYEAAQSSMTRSTLKTWDAHNDMMAKSAELRKIQARKEYLEQQNIERRTEQRELLQEAAIERATKNRRS